MLRDRITLLLLALLLLGCASLLPGQQKPQWMPGQMGMNAGILPDPGLTYANISVNYNSGQFNGPNGKPLPATGNYNVWVVENVVYYVPDQKVLGGNLGFMMILTPATGSLAAEIQPPVAGIENLAGSAGGSGLADLWIQPFTLGWHAKRMDFLVADAFMAPTGRYHPGASNNVGTGYFGNHFQTGTTIYLTKNKGTSANLFTDWEVHGSRQGSNGTSKTPGQAFTDEWGFGQVFPLKKDFTQLLQLGAVGYDQFQLTANTGTIPIGSVGPINVTAPASILPYYKVHAAGGQATFILPKKNLSFNFKCEHEFSSANHFLGNTIVFGGVFTLKIPQ